MCRQKIGCTVRVTEDGDNEELNEKKDEEERGGEESSFLDENDSSQQQDIDTPEIVIEAHDPGLDESLVDDQGSMVSCLNCSFYITCSSVRFICDVRKA